VSEIQFHQQVQQWAELEREGQAEADWRKREDGELIRQEIEEREEAEFVRSLEEQFPILTTWPKKDAK
jgi:hypothetical protein